jgi:hypothetical protein
MKKSKNNEFFKNHFGRKKSGYFVISGEKILYEVGFSGIFYVKMYSERDLGQKKYLK